MRQLTDNERAQLSVVAFDPSNEVEWLIKLIEELTGQTITPADDDTYCPLTTTKWQC